MQLKLVIIHLRSTREVWTLLYIIGSRTLLDFGFTKLGYKCHENRLSGKISNVMASSFNQIEQETNFSQGILMLQVLVLTGIKW